MTAQTDRAFQLSLAPHRPPVDYDRPPVYSGMIAERDVLVPMRAGVRMAVDIYRPETTDKLPALPSRSTTRTCKDPSSPRRCSANPPGRCCGPGRRRLATPVFSYHEVTST